MKQSEVETEPQGPEQKRPQKSHLFTVLLFVVVALVLLGAFTLIERKSQDQALAKETETLSVPTVAGGFVYVGAQGPLGGGTGGNGNVVGQTISVWPEGGEVVGSWGGSMNLPEGGEFVFENVTPGKYFISDNPGARFQKHFQATLIEVKAGETVEVELKK